MGIQGSGKGTHAKMLAADFDLEHIAVGDIFRWNLQHHTKLGAQVRRTMAAGLLIGAAGAPAVDPADAEPSAVSAGDLAIGQYPRLPQDPGGRSRGRGLRPGRNHGTQPPIVTG